MNCTTCGANFTGPVCPVCGTQAPHTPPPQPPPYPYVTCTNCGNIFIGQFCTVCGCPVQKQHHSRPQQPPAYPQPQPPPPPVYSPPPQYSNIPPQYAPPQQPAPPQWQSPPPPPPPRPKINPIIPRFILLVLSLGTVITITSVIMNKWNSNSDSNPSGINPGTSTAAKDTQNKAPAQNCVTPESFKQILEAQGLTVREESFSVKVEGVTVVTGLQAVNLDANYQYFYISYYGTESSEQAQLFFDQSYKDHLEMQKIDFKRVGDNYFVPMTNDNDIYSAVVRSCDALIYIEGQKASYEDAKKALEALGYAGIL